MAAHFAKQYAIKERRTWIVAESKIDSPNNAEKNRYYSMLGTFLADDFIVKRALKDKHLKKILKDEAGSTEMIKKITKWFKQRMKK